MNNSAITIEALNVLDAIESRGSFAAAAEQLNKVPSALSYIVQKLEEQLAVTLFVRQGRRSVLTPAGRHLLNEGRQLLRAVNRLSEQTQTISHGWEPKIRIAVDSIFPVNLLFAPMKQFLDLHPNIEIDICEEVMAGSWESLIDDKVDLLIGAPEPVPNQQGLRAQPIGKIQQLLVAAPRHPITQLKGPISQDEISPYRTVVVHDSVKTAVARSSYIIEQSQHFYVTSVSHKIEAITAGIGVGFLPKVRIADKLKNGSLVAIELDEQPRAADLFMSWKLVNKGKGLKTLREMLIEHISSLT
ncbi:LysR substrate-binding domain-containing protein [Thalassotalea crassostreae]|uniref:LysR substrate-binding domain-containing protein n=1 Tax=Thalassotalea crassostreae TaxID=1763536 RepID=UPI0008381A2D|nr:LysR substrate-binding domain-containing protein [Thalassotalea crassostreae]